MVINNFIEDVFDARIEDINLPQFIKFDTSELLYEKLLTCTDLLHNLQFHFLWQHIFGVYPTKLDVVQALKSVPIKNYDSYIAYISTTTFIKYVNNIIQAKQHLKSLYYKYTQELNNNTTFVKQALIDKFVHRYCNGRKPDGIDKLSLFKAYVKVRENGNIVEAQNIDFQNPINGFHLQQNIPAINNTDKLSKFEIERFCIMSDYYFMRTLLFNNMLLINCANDGDAMKCCTIATEVIKAFQGKINIFALSNVTNLLKEQSAIKTANVSIYTLHSEADFASIPSLADIFVCINYSDIHVAQKSYYTNNYYIVPYKYQTVNDVPRSNIITVHDTLDSLSNINIVNELYNHDILYTNGNSNNNILTSPEWHIYYFRNLFHKQASYKELNYKFVQDALMKYMAFSIPSIKSYSNPTLPKNCVLLVDNRENIMSVFSAILSITKLPVNEWKLVICTRQKNKDFYLKFLSIYDPIFIEHDLQYIETFDIEHYNIILKDTTFWQQLSAFDKCLIIQDDALILREGIHTFMDFDYVGAPWDPKHFENKILASVANPQLVGNGGLSLRSVKAMIDVCSKCKKEKMLLFNDDLSPIPEDVYFARCCYHLKYKIPTFHQASFFSSEQVLNIDSIGVHKLWAYHRTDQVLDYFRGLFR